MKTLNLYIGRKLVSTTLAAVGVLTFVLLSGHLIKAFDLLARGVSAGTMGRFFLYLVPVALKFTLPFSLLCAVILVFSRLSADNEITAMRATGISLWQIVSPALLLGILLSGANFYLHMNLSPYCRYRLDQLKDAESVRNPLAILEAGRFVELPGYVIYVGKRDGDQLTDLHVYALGRNGKVVQDITALSGEVKLQEDRRRLELVLTDATIVAADPASPDDNGKLSRVASKTIGFPLDYGQQLDSKSLARKLKHLESQAIFGLIHAYAERGIDTTPLVIELHKRMSMALSPFAFLLVGIPLGIRTRRSEAAVGLVISIAMAGVFFAFLIIADNLKQHGFHSLELIVWLPNILYQIGGLTALYRLARL